MGGIDIAPNPRTTFLSDSWKRFVDFATKGKGEPKKKRKRKQRGTIGGYDRLGYDD